MPHIIPQSELVRRAAAWICAQREDDAAAGNGSGVKTLSSLLDEAGMRFNLSPLEQRMLLDLFSRPDDVCGSDAAGRHF